LEAIIKNIYKDDIILATTYKWEAIRTDRNKIKRTHRKSIIKRKQEHVCGTL